MLGHIVSCFNIQASAAQGSTQAAASAPVAVPTVIYDAARSATPGLSTLAAMVGISFTASYAMNRWAFSKFSNRFDSVDRDLKGLKAGQEAIHKDVKVIKDDVAAIRPDAKAAKEGVARLEIGQAALRTDVQNVRAEIKSGFAAQKESHDELKGSVDKMASAVCGVEATVAGLNSNVQSIQASQAALVTNTAGIRAEQSEQRTILQRLADVPTTLQTIANAPKQLLATVQELTSRVSDVETRQANLEAGQKDLKEGQSFTNQRVIKLEQAVKELRDEVSTGNTAAAQRDLKTQQDLKAIGQSVAELAVQRNTPTYSSGPVFFTTGPGASAAAGAATPPKSLPSRSALTASLGRQNKFNS